ncbi:MAG: 3'(2'),5'-bisphosphate nucleotidase CysQ [Nitrospirae bacterium]|nr:3'(2'),5'-bisphosphate nucleotidase CysQ [Nitrospirota bacterium]
MQAFLIERLHPLIPGLLRISRDAGAAILDVYDSDFAVEHKDDKSPLTLADRRSHEVIVTGLSELGGMDIPVLSEEGKNIPFEERRAWEFFWLVDPLDGTKEFIKRNGEFTVNIALIHRGRTVLGVIYIPVKGLFYFGAQGLGSFRLPASSTDDLASADTIAGMAARLPDPVAPAPFTVAGSRSHMSPETEAYIATLRERHGDIAFVSAGSSLKFCLVAEGRAQVYPRFAPTMEWDTAAGQAIVECAGGTVLRTDAPVPLEYNKENLLNPWFVASAVYPHA